MTTTNRNDGQSGNFPLNHLRLDRLNSTLRHRLRNFCAGMKIAIGTIAETTDPQQTGEHCGLMQQELSRLLEFSERMDLLIDKLPPAEPRPISEIMTGAEEMFSVAFPFCSIKISGKGDSSTGLVHGSWYSLLLKELLTNAGEAAGSSGEVKIGWSVDPVPAMLVVNSGAGWPENIPTCPPCPFSTSKGQHTGIGLSIAQKICSRMNAQLEIITDMPDRILTKVVGDPEEVL